MKKAFRLFFIYTGVLLMAFVATVVFCAAFLFFYREGDIFGFRYVNANEIVLAAEQDEMTGLTSIEVNGKDFPIKVSVRPGIKQLQGAMYNRVFGYTNKKLAQAKFELNYNEATKKAVFDVSNEPSGWLNKDRSYIQVVIPVDMAKNGINLEVNSAKGDISLYCEEDIKNFNINNLTIKTSKGDANIYGVNIVNSMNIDMGSGKFIVHDNASTSKEIDVNLAVGSGTIDLKTKIVEDKFTLGNIKISKMEQGTIGILDCNEVNSNGNINGGGDLVVSKTQFIDFASKNTDIKIGNITGIVLSRIRLSGYGDVSIERAKCPITVEGYNGDINIKTCLGKMILSANQGDITVANAFSFIDANTLYGKINVRFDETANGYDATNQHRSIQATTKNGSIVVHGLEVGAITATDQGRISLVYNRVVADNFVTAKSGTVYIQVPNATSNASNYNAFNLNVSTEVNSNIKVGVAGTIGNVNSSQSGTFSYSNIYNSATFTSNNLNVVSETGIIKIRSNDLVNY